MSTQFTPLLDQVSNQQLVAKARNAAGNLWLCSLGAYSLAMKSSVRTVQKLVLEGKAMQPKARQQFEEKSTELIDVANATIQRGEQLVRERFFRPLDFLLLATRRDIEQLSLRVIELSDEVHRLATGKTKAEAEPAAPEEPREPPLLANAA